MVSRNVGFEEITEGQNNAHTQHNITTKLLDALIRGGVTDRLTATPASPADGDVYIIFGGAPSGQWLTDGRSENDVAIWLTSDWYYFTPEEGWMLRVVDENVWVYWDGSAWTTLVSLGFAQIAADADITDSTNGTAANGLVDLDLTDNTAEATPDTTIGDTTVGGSSGGTGDGTFADASGAVTGVDGTGNNAASKADVDTRLSDIADNFTDIQDSLTEVDSNFADQVLWNTKTQDALAALAAEINDLRAKMRTSTVLAT